MVNLGKKAQLNRETFATYGLAMYHAQCVEKSLALLISSVFNKNFLKSTPDKRELFYKKYFDKTFGQLLSEIKKKITISKNLEVKLKKALKKRNWLAHDYSLEKSGEILLEKGKEKMIDELTELSKFFSEVDLLLMGAVNSWAKQHGITENILDTHLENFIEETNKNL